MEPSKNPSYTSLLHVCISLLHVVYQVKSSHFLMKCQNSFENQVKANATPLKV